MQPLGLQGASNDNRGRIKPSGKLPAQIGHLSPEIRSHRQALRITVGKADSASAQRLRAQDRVQADRRGVTTDDQHVSARPFPKAVDDGAISVDEIVGGGGRRDMADRLRCGQQHVVGGGHHKQVGDPAAVAPARA